MVDKKKFFEDLQESIVALKEEETVELCKKGLELGLDPAEIIDLGLMQGIRIVGEKYEDHSYALPHMVIGADVMQAGMKIIEPELFKGGGRRQSKGRVVIGTVSGDIHDIGKNIVSIILTANGYEVKDLGKDVPNETFIKEAREFSADFICMSALMTTTVGNQEKLINQLETEGLRNDLFVVVGGSALTRNYAEKIGADGFGETAQEAVSVLDSLIKLS